MSTQRVTAEAYVNVSRTIHSDWRWVTTDIRLRTRSSGGWLVQLASNGRDLGWLYEHEGRWEARATSSAFRGGDVDDTGDVLDDVPEHLTNGGISSTRPCGYGATKQEAVEALLDHLHQNHSPALGYGRHHAVRVYERAAR